MTELAAPTRVVNLHPWVLAVEDDPASAVEDRPSFRHGLAPSAPVVASCAPLGFGITVRRSAPHASAVAEVAEHPGSKPTALIEVQLRTPDGEDFRVQFASAAHTDTGVLRKVTAVVGERVRQMLASGPSGVSEQHPLRASLVDGLNGLAEAIRTCPQPTVAPVSSAPHAITVGEYQDLFAAATFSVSAAELAEFRSFFADRPDGENDAGDYPLICELRTLGMPLELFATWQNVLVPSYRRKHRQRMSLQDVRSWFLFHHAGWTPPEYQAFRKAAGVQKQPDRKWSRFEAEDAILAARLNMTITQLDESMSSGEWSRDGARTVLALSHRAPLAQF